MKIMTLNVHSHFDKMTTYQFENALEQLTEIIALTSLDIVALQECSQTCGEEALEGTLPGSFIPVGNDQIRKDNFACLLAKRLEEKGLTYFWSWTGAKIGYDRFDEGLAILSKHPVIDQDAFYYSGKADYHNWKSRKTIGLCTKIDGIDTWFYSVHMGWWKDDEEPFVPQMDRLQKVMDKKTGNVFLLGDFNSQADIRGEGYDYVKSLGWQDTYLLAKEKDCGVTVPGVIDGWTDVANGMRIDYIFAKKPVEVLSSRVVFNGGKEPVISDHFGVMIEVSMGDE